MQSPRECRQSVLALAGSSKEMLWLVLSEMSEEQEYGVDNQANQLQGHSSRINPLYSGEMGTFGKEEDKKMRGWKRGRHMYRCNHTKAQDERTNNLPGRNLEGALSKVNASTRMDTPADNKDPLTWKSIYEVPVCAVVVATSQDQKNWP